MRIDYRSYIGKTVGGWTILSKDGPCFVARCGCGVVKRVYAHGVISGQSTRCGGCRDELRGAPGTRPPGDHLQPRVERFWDKVFAEPMTGCWLWCGDETGGGYGRVSSSILGETRSHRISWRLARGEIPDGLCVLHKCDTRLCVNPSHLFLGTRPENTADMMSKGRSYRKLSSADVEAIKTAVASGEACTDVAARFGVRAPAIWKIKHGRTWRNVG